jgi:hypothetical protein
MLAAIIAALIVLGILASVYTFIQTKNTEVDTRIKAMNAGPSMEDRISATNTLLETIDNTIMTQIKGTLKFYVRLARPYPAIKMGDDIERISKIVYDSLVKEVFTNDQFIITEDYIMEYITSETSLLFISVCQELNIEIGQQ